MVCISLRNSLTPSTLPSYLIPTTYSPTPVNLCSVGFDLHICRRKSRWRGISVITRAGPSSTSYIFAFVFPLSLLAVTIFTSIRVADKLDQKFFEELAVEQAILEEEDNENEISSSPEREAAPTRNRNRPKREVNSSSM